MIGIVVSRADRASIAIGDALLDIAEWETSQDPSLSEDAGGGAVHRRDGFELRTFEQLHLELAGVADTFTDPDAVVFVSKHAGDTGPLLTTHTPGNVGSAAYGGDPHCLPPAAPALMKRVYNRMHEYAPATYDVGIECTHHGPSAVGAPTLFAEVGSGPDQWSDGAAAEAVARAVLDIEGCTPTSRRTVVGFGGGHYAPRFTRIMDRTDWHVGHIAASWALDEIDDPATRSAVIEKAIERSQSDVALVDGEPDLVASIESTGTRVVSETWLREADGRSIDVVDRIEELLGPIDTGTRIGDRHAPTPDRLERIEIPDAVIEPINGHDPETGIDTVAANTIAFDTRENGNRLAGSVVVHTSDDLTDLVEAVQPLLAEQFDQVHLDENELILRDTAFDPTVARELGVPEGPAFGQLANGESVTVDGNRIDPAEVHRETEQRIGLQTN